MWLNLQKAYLTLKSSGLELAVVGHASLVLALGRQRQENLWVGVQPSHIHSGFQDSQSYTEKSCLENQKKKKKSSGFGPYHCKTRQTYWCTPITSAFGRWRKTKRWTLFSATLWVQSLPRIHEIWSLGEGGPSQFLKAKLCLSNLTLRGVPKKNASPIPKALPSLETILCTCLSTTANLPGTYSPGKVNADQHIQ